MNNNDKLRSCPVCNRSGRRQFCCKCIRNGDFTHSSIDSLQRFSDRKLKFINLKTFQAQVCHDVNKCVYNNVLKEQLMYKINKLEKSHSILERIIAEKRDHFKLSEQLKLKQQREILERHKNRKQREERINETKNIRAKVIVDLNGRLNHYNEQVVKAQIALREKIYSLRHIFPMAEEHFPDGDEHDEANEQSETSPLIDQEDQVIHKHNVAKKMDNDVAFVKYRIGETWICLNEDYTSCLCEPNRVDYANNRNLNVRSDEFRKGAALSYLCHMSQLIAYFCDLHLPKAILFRDFFSKDTRKEEILCRTAKLNANITLLCIYFNVSHQSINPKQPYRNMKLLIDKSSSGQPLNINMRMSTEFYTYVRKHLEDDLKLDTSPKKENNTGTQEEGDYHFVETSLPDLNLDKEEEVRARKHSTMRETFETEPCSHCGKQMFPNRASSPCLHRY